MPKGAEPDYNGREHILGPYGVVKVVKMEQADATRGLEDGAGGTAGRSTASGAGGNMTMKQQRQQQNPGAQKKAEKKGDGNELSNAAGGGRLDDVQRIIDECYGIEDDHLKKTAGGRHNHDNRGDNHLYETINNRRLAGMTPLMYAAGFGHLNIVQLLCRLTHRSGGPICKVNLQDLKYGMTALHQAAANDHPEVVEYLLEQGANPNLKDKSGRTALDRSQRPTYGRRHSRVVDMIMTHHDMSGTDPAPSGPNSYGATSGRGLGGGAKFAKNKLRPGSQSHQHPSSDQRPKQLEDLDIEQVHSLLEGLNMGSYADSFRAQEIDGATLAHCEDVDLEMLGMAFRPKRQRLLIKIDELMEKGCKPSLFQNASSGGDRTMGGGMGRSGGGRLTGGGSGGRENDMGNSNGYTSRSGGGSSGGGGAHKQEMMEAQEDELHAWYGRRAGQSTKGLSKPKMYW